jgi:hypothetical protein
LHRVHLQTLYRRVLVTAGFVTRVPPPAQLGQARVIAAAVGTATTAPGMPPGTPPTASNEDDRQRAQPDDAHDHLRLEQVAVQLVLQQEHRQQDDGRDPSPGARSG